jgi:hypothetical protein
MADVCWGLDEASLKRYTPMAVLKACSAARSGQGRASRVSLQQALCRSDALAPVSRRDGRLDGPFAKVLYFT